MKIIIKNQQNILLRFDAQEEVLTGIANYCTTENIPGAHFTIIGSAGEITLAYYNLPAKQFEDQVFKEELEVVSVIGNVGTLDNKHVVHAHGVFSKSDLSTIAGHIKTLTVSATCEVFLTKLEGTIERQHDEVTGLNLLK